MSSAYPELFSPLTLHSVTLRNRIVHASMTTKMGVAQCVSESLINYHRNRALGGAGMIVTEPLAVAPWHRDAHKVSVFGDTAIDGLSRWAEAVEQNGCRLLGQLQDSGRGRHEKGRHPYAIGPSALPDDLSWTVPRAMSVSEIETFIDTFVEASWRLKKVGFSGVEISAAHGHLFHQFLSPWSNLRDDEWGGSVINRTRFVRELALRIRDRCGTQFIIGLKIPGIDGVERSIDIQEAGQITAALALPEVVSYLCYAQGSHSHALDLHVPDMYGPRVPYRTLIRKMRQCSATIPLMALGLITDPAEAQRLVADGDSELVALGRPLVTDPAWPNKSHAGRAAEIRYCVSCNTCWATIIRDGAPIACDNNPRVGKVNEVDWWPQPVAESRRVVIVGGGVAGLETAWVAAARGHDVTLLSRESKLGGKTWLQAQLPGGENLSSVYDYQLQAAQRAGVTIQVTGDVTSARIIAMQPEVVVLATGSSMIWPRELPDELREEECVKDLRETMAELLHFERAQGGTAVIYDQDHSAGTYMAATRLRALFDRVVIITPRETVAQKEALVMRQSIYRRINECSIEIMPFSGFGDVSSLEQGVLMVRNLYTGIEVPINDIAVLTYATPRQPNDKLVAPLTEAGLEVQLVGDCLMPDSLLAATSKGHAMGNAL